MSIFSTFTMGTLQIMAFKKNIILFLLAISCVACNKQHTSEKDTLPNNGQLPPSLLISKAAANRVADTLWKTSQKKLSNTLTQATILQHAIEALLKKPSQQSLQLAQKEWHTTTAIYQQLSPLLYLEHKKIKDPLKTSGALSSIHHWRNRIAAWPIQPGFIDSFGPHIHSGIVNDINLPIDAHTLRRQHLFTDDQEVTLGLYSIEYLLFGDRDYHNKKNTHYKRFLEVTILPEPLAKAGLAINELPNNRRRSLIALQARLLVNDIQTLIGLYQSSGALSLEFQELTTLEKLQAFKNSTSLSLQYINRLLTFHQEELLTDDTTEEKSTDKKNKKQCSVCKRFYNNTMLALQNNLITINSLYATSELEKDSKNILLSDALLTKKAQENVITLIKRVEEGSNKKEGRVDEIALATESLSKALQH